MGIPTIGFYGPTNPKQWGSPKTSDTILFKEEVECSPCYKDGKFPDCDHLTCLTSIEVEEVWTKMQQILTSPLAKKIIAPSV
jgi:ADP-heptose:LPS heptosyltransferase